MRSFPEIKIRPRPGNYTCGIETIRHILNATLRVLVEDGYRALTLRRIAVECGLKVGNLTYYFPNKEALVQEMLEGMINGYQDSFNAAMDGASATPEGRLEACLHFALQDLQSKRTTRVFPELWALANHDPFVAGLVGAFYRQAQVRIAGQVHDLNPALSPDDCATVAVLISSTIEGLTIFAGHGKPNAADMPRLAGLAIRTLVSMVRTLRPEDIGALAAQWAFDEMRTVFANGNAAPVAAVTPVS